MSKTLLEIYAPQATATGEFIKLQDILKYSDRNGNGDAVFKGSTEKDKSRKADKKTDDPSATPHEPKNKAITTYNTFLGTPPGPISGPVKSEAVESEVKDKDKKADTDEDEETNEELKPSMGAGAYIHDFVKSDDPKFKSDSKKERIKRALGAFYSDKDKGAKK